MPIDCLRSGDEDFLTVVELADDVVRLEAMIDGPLLLWHSPPGEVHLFPWRAVSNGLIPDCLVSLGALERLSHILTVVEVSEGASGHEGGKGTLSDQVALLGRHALN